MDYPIELFWKKKTIVSFLLAVFVFLLHIQSFDLYKYGSDIGFTVIRFIGVYITKAWGIIAVPLFFVISGALFFRNYSNKNYGKKIKSRFFSLVIPYLFWNSIPLATMFFRFIISGNYESSFGETNFFLTVFHHQHNVIFWFIFDLIIFIILSPLLDLFLRKRVVAYSVLFLILLLKNWNIELPETVFFRSDSIFFYYLGCLIGRWHFGLFSRVNYNRSIMIVATVILFACNVLSSVIMFNNIVLHKTLDTLFLLVYIVAFWFVSNCVIHFKMRVFYYDSFMIYALHQKISRPLCYGLYRLLPPINILSLFLNFSISFSITLLLIILSSTVLKRYLPHIYNFISGNRK